jgi:hypothetical protein
MHTTTDYTIILYFLQNTKGIRGTANHFGISKVYVGKIINRYLKGKI